MVCIMLQVEMTIILHWRNKALKWGITKFLVRMELESESKKGLSLNDVISEPKFLNHEVLEVWI